MSSTDDEVALTPIKNVVEMATPYVYPIIRVVLALGVIWFVSSVSSHRRFFSGISSSLFAGFLVYTFLEPLFVPVGAETAMVFLYMLSMLGALVGMSLGVLLPTLFPGFCLGGNLTLFVGALVALSNVYYFPIIGCLLAVTCGTLSARFNPIIFTTLTAALEGGAVVSCLVFKTFLLYLMDVTRGYPYYPKSIGGPPNHTKEEKLFWGLAWLVSSLLVIVAIVYKDRGWSSFNIIAAFRLGYTTIPSTDQERRSLAPKAAEPALSTRDTPENPEGYNMFNPAELPPRLAEYANMVYSACEDLGNFFGFQDSSVRNQAEHLLILLSNNRRYMSSHILPPPVQPPSPIHALHAKVFSNYVKWCRAMGVAPNFSKMNTSMNAPPAVASRVVDLVLWFCVWGEGSNLRHMPECVWFLYHKMMEEYILSEGYTQTRSLYAGHYLDCVVTPIYRVVQTSMSSSADHDERRNYDDFNEFFWSRKCLQYHYSSATSNHPADVELTNNLVGLLPGESLPPVAEGLAVAPKTFLEKRSWLRGVLALSRVLEWHIVTFYLLGVFAFAQELVWGSVFVIQVASAVFWIFNALHLGWALMEVWASYPGIQLSFTEVCGSVFVLVARFLTLVYQTLYLMWAFAPQKGHYLGIEGDSTFWWWQYIWLSLLVMLPYFVESVLQLVPSLATRLYTSQNDYIQSFLNILYPLSRLYVCKEVHESFGHTVVYVIFWVTLMTWKLFFSYIFEVYSMVLPSLELTDDYVNYPNQSFAKMVLLLSMRWLPQFIVYLIDMSIWYAAWQAFAGTSVGFSDHLGDIRSFDDIRKNFGRAPEHFCSKMLSPDAGSRRGSSASFLGSGNSLSEGTSLLGADAHKLSSYMTRLLDVRIQKWVMFSAAWNEIIDHFREEDIISSSESDNLKFSQFDGFSQAIYLPVFQTAGAIEDLLAELERPVDDYKDPKTGSFSDESFFKPISKHITRQTAVAEVWELGSFLFLQILGNVHAQDVQAVVAAVTRWAENSTLTSHMKIEAIRGCMVHFIELVDILNRGIPRRKPMAKPKPPAKRVAEKPVIASSGMRRVVSAGSLSTLESEPKSREVPKAMNEISPKKVEVIDALRDQVRDKLRSVIHSIKNLLKNTQTDPECRDVLDRLTFLGSMENGFFWEDNYASGQIDDISKNETVKAVLKKMYGLVCMHPDDAEPKSQEVHRRLTFFVNSLFMDMPDAPSIHDMFSWNVLTPFYAEDVTYSKAELEKRSDALGVSTLLYLQTLYRADWNNFLERLGIKDEEKIWSKKYIDETRRWASIRAQTLSRTVNGMMYSEKALRLLANLERLDEETTKDLLLEKFGYVVACQTYGTMKRNQDPKADDVDALMHRFPHMRVAYIDTIRINRSGASIFYSVLVKSDGRGKVQEVYRVRLPGDPVIGEGKPENQNHAIIFTRGEFVQTIDMNQEGYFEEALKMRNCLQEFAKREGPLPTTILGLREHIFTGSVSSLANYMALQEISFVTLGQRVLAKPLRIRLHYGHPDVFDKLFFITRGGLSKASKGINLSEDIFAGYSNVVRGGSIGFKEYVQVGKGRDVGMSQIYKFEAKLSQGAAEQSLSRDVYRMCNRLDFFRLLSFYYGGIGHYFSNVLTVATVYIVVYLMAVLAIFNLEKIGDRVITPMGTIQMLLGGLGLLQTIPLFATLGVERGWWASIQEIILVFVTGGPLHFMFHIQTKANYMAQTILVGGAKYRPTGRGFVTQHTPFDEQFRFFASSHLYLGFELAAGLILMGIYTKAKQYPGRTWSLWLASASFLCSPFWFNPLTFDWNVVTSDYDLWFKWIRGSSGGANKSWSMWWNEENAFYKKMPFSSKLIYYVKIALYLLIGDGIRRSGLFRSNTILSKPGLQDGQVLIFLGLMLLLWRLFMMSESTLPYPIRRTISIVLFLGMVAGVIALFVGNTNYIRFALAGYYWIGAISLLGLLHGVKIVKYCYMVHDIVCGHLMFLVLFLSAALQLPAMLQTWLLYHNALSADVVVSDILRYARRTQESGSRGEGEEDLIEQITELRKLVQKQEQILAQSGLATNGSEGGLIANNLSNTSNSMANNSGGPSSGVGSGASQRPTSIATNPFNGVPVPMDQVVGREGGGGVRSYGRAFSMSGLDVWGTMALGDVHSDDVRPAVAATSPPVMGMMDVPSSAVSTTSAVPSPFGSGFTFTQPETMPPR